MSLLEVNQATKAHVSLIGVKETITWRETSNWWYWVSRGHSCLYILQKVEIWTGVTDAWRTDSLTTLKDRATQLLIKYKSGALVTQYQVLPILAPSRKAKHKGKCPYHTPKENDPKNWKGYKPEFYSSLVWSSTIEQGAYKPYEGAYVHFCFSNSIWQVCVLYWNASLKNIEIAMTSISFLVSC